MFGAYAVTMAAMILNNLGGGSTGWAWLAPEAWFRITVPFGGNHAWRLPAFVVISAVPVLLSYVLSVRRDMGAGLVPQRDGSAHASPRFDSALALAWRQHKSGILVWAFGMAWLGGIMGIGTPNISEAISSTFIDVNALWSSAIMKLGNQEAFIAMLVYILGLMGGLSVFALTTVHRLRQEEKEQYVDAVLSRPVSRVEWMGSHLTVAFAGSVVILFALGASAGLGWSLASGEFNHVTRVVGMSLSKIPSVWTIIGIAALLYGWLPRAASVLGWLILGVWILVEMLWEVGIVGWSAMQWTPFAYAHYIIPIHELPIVPLIVLTGAAAACTWAGIIGFRRRSIG